MSGIDWKALAAPFPITDLEWRVGSTSRDKSRGMVLCYLTARAVMDRLDTVVGPESWRHSIRREGNAWLCRLEVSDGSIGDWIFHEDASDESDIEGIKGGASGAFKRAAVHFGIGRYLYRLPDLWAPLEQGKYLPRDFTPKLPAWALPGGSYNPGLISPAGAGVSPTEPHSSPPAPAPSPPDPEPDGWDWASEGSQKPPAAPKPPRASQPEPAPDRSGDGQEIGMKPPWWDVPIGFGKFSGKTMGHMVQGSADGERIGWLEWYVQQPIKTGKYEESNRKFHDRCRAAIEWKRSRV